MASTLIKYEKGKDEDDTETPEEEASEPTLYTIALSAYLIALTAHIRTKTVNFPFHKATEDGYNELFEIAHHIGEKMEDMDSPIETMHPVIEGDFGTLEECANAYYEALEDLKEELEEAISDNKDMGYDNLLRQSLDTVQTLCGTARGFIS